MPLPKPHPIFEAVRSLLELDTHVTVTAKNPADQHLADLLQKICDRIFESDEACDELGVPRKGREPDYLYGRWCVQCHNSLPQDWVTPCDVCGAKTVTDGAMFDRLFSKMSEMYGGIPRAEKEE